MNRAHQHATNLSRTTGALSNHPNLLVEPPDLAIGRCRGGLTTMIYQLCDGNMRPLVVLLGTGQGDSLMLPEIMVSLRVDRIGPGRARTRPDRVLADKAYSAKAHRAMLRHRIIQLVIPERSDQVANRKRRRRNGGCPVDLDIEAYKRRNVLERSSNTLNWWRGLATRSDKLAHTYRGGAV